ncbi:MAG: DUF4258 domain-containing protein [Chloroflexi bacterium]|nr:DUF4258 domain-containing protein [Chloroflexota bacterium]
MKPIVFTTHARDQCSERGATEAEVVTTIRSGEKVAAKRGQHGYRMNFQYHDVWSGRRYAIKQVLAIVAEESNALVVVTVYTFYF